MLRVLAIVAGKYGVRIVEHIRRCAPSTWQVTTIPAPAGLPIVVDAPEEHLPPDLPPADLILFMAENDRAAQLLPALILRTGARAVIAPIDHAAWIPPGLRGQLLRELSALGGEIVFPEPFCALTEEGLGPIAAEFARHFGRPVFRIRAENGVVQAVEVERDTACGCARFVAEHLVGQPLSEAVFQAGILHHHYPCLAGMTMEKSLGDTLLHVSGQLMRQAVEVEIAPLLPRAAYLVPEGRAAK